MADRDRAPRRARPRRSRPAPPPAAVLELNGHAVEPVEPAPPATTAVLDESVPLNAVPEKPASPPEATVRAEAAGPQPAPAPVWAWKGAVPAMPLKVIFDEALVAAEVTPAAAAATPVADAPAATGPTPSRHGVERILLLAIPAAVALGVVILLSRTLPEPSGAGDQTIWWSVLAAAGLTTLVILDLAARRLRPSVLAGAGLPRLGGGLGEMTVVVAVAALLAGAGVLRLPASPGSAGTVTAAHTAAVPPPAVLAPAAVPPPATAQAPAAPVPPTQRTPATGGGGADLPVLALDPAMTVRPAVTRLSSRGALPLPPPMHASRGGAAADAAALSGTVGTPDGAPVVLGPVAPASAATAASHPRASGEAGAASCGTADGAPCPADELHSLSADFSSATATLDRSEPPACTAAARTAFAPPMGGACTEGVHVEMLTADPARAVVADGVSSSSLTAGCPAAPIGRVSIGDLEVGGVHVAGGPGALVPTSTPEPDTAVTLGAGTVVLNEQRPDREGRGLTVNAVHIVVPATLLSPFSLDMVIGHSHSAATSRSSCADAPAHAVTVAPAPAGGVTPGAPEGVLPDVLQIRRVLRGLISL